MIPAAFDYVRAASVNEALDLLAKHGDDAKILAGGHSLIPAMKLRLSQPKIVIDISRIGDLRSISQQNGKIAIGALATHYEIESSDLLKRACPLLPEVAGKIGDVQVRNKGTVGGSCVHADPAGDWPAAMLALDAEFEIASSSGSRTVAAKDFFVDILTSAVGPGEILKFIHVPATANTVAYVKFAQKASGFAIAGVAAVIDKTKKEVAVAVTGVAAKAYRASGTESSLRGVEPTADSIAAAAEKAADGIDPLSDIHASADFRAHLARVQAKRALWAAVSRG
ncbi:MAG: xanthine dehydrogenase family protein subunit M [Acidobacteriaceae bacterium]|nr:xanthine dehydrogenase family protein subunit M [Acidobacteriaceae bacterium]